MKRLNKFVAVLGLASVLVAGSSSAFAKSESRQRVITGSIISINRDSRTMVVRHTGTNRTIVVQVPANARIRTNVTSGGSFSFEQLIAGMAVRDLVVE